MGDNYDTYPVESTTLAPSDVPTDVPFGIPSDDHDNIPPQTPEVDDDETLAKNNEAQESSGEERTRYNPGQVLRFIRVRFPGNALSFPFLLGKRKFAYGQKVVALSDRGMAVGYINSFPYELPYSAELEPIRTISKIATTEDIEKEASAYKKQKEAEVYCNQRIIDYNLDMILTHVEFTQWGKKAVLYFNAPQRVDFRDLVKDLVYHLKMRVELRQISVRDRTAAIGGLGPCGRELCCSSFLGRYGNISIKMAKNQNMTMNPSKLNGVCGQLKCCVKYEDEVYSHKRNQLPFDGEIVLLKNGDKARVQRLHILIEQFDAMTDTGLIKRYSINQYDPKLKLPADYKFPDQFENVSLETDDVIGLEQYEEDLAKKFETELVYDFTAQENMAFNYYRGYSVDHVLTDKEEEEKYDQKSAWEKEEKELFPIKAALPDLDDDDEDEDEEEDAQEQGMEESEEENFDTHRRETQQPPQARRNPPPQRMPEKNVVPNPQQGQGQRQNQNQARNQNQNQNQNQGNQNRGPQQPQGQNNGPRQQPNQRRGHRGPPKR